MKKFVSLSVIAGAVLPFVASAATGVTAFTLLGQVARFLNYLIPVLVTIAVVYFIWTVITYTLGDEKKKEAAKKNITPALIGLFLIVAFWGILSLITSTTGVGPLQLKQKDIPCIPNPAAGIFCPQ